LEAGVTIRMGKVADEWRIKKIKTAITWMTLSRFFFLLPVDLFFINILSLFLFWFDDAVIRISYGRGRGKLVSSLGKTRFINNQIKLFHLA
jgi:hypothetical protein